MECAMTKQAERREADERPADPELGRLTLTLHAGASLEIIDLSAEGALVETAARLEPGTHLSIRSTSTQDRIADRATVIHCCVCSLDRRTGIRFRAGLQFETGSNYPAEKHPTRGENVLPKQGRPQEAMWARRAPFRRARCTGTQVG
jgi:hypothetical protein